MLIRVFLIVREQSVSKYRVYKCYSRWSIHSLKVNFTLQNRYSE